MMIITVKYFLAALTMSKLSLAFASLIDVPMLNKDSQLFSRDKCLLLLFEITSHETEVFCQV